MRGGAFRTESLRDQAALAALAAIVITGSRFVLAAIAARRLSQTEFGQFAYAIWLVDVAFLVCSLGATGAVGRYIAEFRSDERRLTAFMRHWRRWAIGLPLLAGLTVVLGGRISGLPFDATSLGLFALWAAVQGRWAMQTAALTGSQRFDVILRANLLAGVTMIVGMMVLPVDTLGLPLVFALMIVSAMFGALTGARHTRDLGAGGVEALLDQGQWKAIRIYAVNVWLTALLWALVWSRGEFPIVRAYLGDESLAAYAAAMTLFGGAVQAVMLGVGGVAPQLTRFWGEGRADLALATARKVMDFQLVACGISAVTLICFGPELMSLAFGNKYRSSAGTLVVLGVGLVAMTLSAQNHLLQIATDARFSRDTSILGLVILMVTALVFTPLLGLYGAALARASTMAVLTIVTIFAVRRRWTDMSPPLNGIVVTSSVSIAAGIAALLLGDAHLGVRAVVFLMCFLVLSLSLRCDDRTLVIVRLYKQILLTEPDARAGRSRGQGNHHH
jgi:O-antigen/teichoic acid export membrane protein